MGTEVYHTMKICLVGDYQGNPDEGMKNIAKYLCDSLEDRGVKILRSSVKDFDSLGFYKRIYDFSPDIIHYVPGISWRSLLLSGILKGLTGANVVVSAIYCPSTVVLKAFSLIPSRVQPKFLPEVIFAHHPAEMASFSSIAGKSRYLPNGVDTDKFKPVSAEERLKLRSEWDIDPDDFVVLHVGHLKDNRNLDTLIRLQQLDCQVLVIASEYLERSSHIEDELRAAGCSVETGYVENIEKLYVLADCYVFPVKKGDTIGMPLSVLEAMACDIPVVTMAHPGISNAFEAGNGLLIAESEEELVESVLEIKDMDTEVDTRCKVKNYSWDEIADRVIQTYEGIGT